MTIYRPAVDVPGCRVGDDGSVWKLLDNREWEQVRPFLREGTAVVCIRRNGKQYCRTVASLVLRSFGVPQPPGCNALRFPDSDPFNNRLSNLRWAPKGIHLIGAKPNAPRGEKCHLTKLTDEYIAKIRDMAQSGEFFLSEIAEQFGLSSVSYVSQIVKGKARINAPGPVDPADTIRVVRGEAKSSSKLTEEDVIRIREMAASGEFHHGEIAELYHVSRVTIRSIARGLKWRHVPGPIIPSGILRGESHNLAKLQESDIHKIRRMARRGMSPPKIAAKFGVSAPTIRNVIIKRTWGHVPEQGG
jgi:hypothetical protein